MQDAWARTQRYAIANGYTGAMKVIDGGPGQRDPLARMGGMLAAVLLAFVVSMLLAALIASQVPGSYSVRAYSYLSLILWTLAGSILLVRVTSRTEAGPFRVRRLVKWMISIWLWPLLLAGRRRSRQP